MLLGGKPGAGKTTVLEYFALQLAKQGTGSLIGPLPVFYRLRHLEENRQRHPGKGLWECLHAHCAGRLNLDLPAGFLDPLVDAPLDVRESSGNPRNPRREMIVLNEIAGFESAFYFFALGEEGITKLAGKGLRQPRYPSRS